MRNKSGSRNTRFSGRRVASFVVLDRSIDLGIGVYFKLIITIIVFNLCAGFYLTGIMVESTADKRL